MELLLLLVHHRGQLVTRQEIVDQLWGSDVFVDVDTSVNTAIRKVRQALRDDPDEPTYVLTVTGKGYRFVTPVTNAGEAVDAPTGPPMSPAPAAPAPPPESPAPDRPATPSAESVAAEHPSARPGHLCRPERDLLRRCGFVTTPAK